MNYQDMARQIEALTARVDRLSEDTRRNWGAVSEQRRALRDHVGASATQMEIATEQKDAPSQEPTTATPKSYRATLSLLLFVDATMPTWRMATLLEVEPAEVRPLIDGKGGNNFGSDAFRKARADAPGWYRVTFEAHVGPKMLKMIGTPTIAPDVDAWRANMTG